MKLLRSRAVVKIFTFIILLIILLQADFHSGNLIKTSQAAADIGETVIVHQAGAIYSPSGSGDYINIRTGLPETLDPLRLYRHHQQPGYIYLTTESQGLFSLDVKNRTWQQLAPAFFKVRSIYNNTKKFRRISAFAIDQINSKHLVCATKHTIYESYNRGASWEKASMKGLGSANYITSLAVNGKLTAAGTSFNGIFINRSGRFTPANTGLPREPYSSSLYFLDEVSCLWWKPGTTLIYAGFSSGRGLFISSDSGRSWRSTGLAIKEYPFFSVDDIHEHEGALYAMVQGTLYTQIHNGPWAPAEIPLPLPALDGKKAVLFSQSNPGAFLYTSPGAHTVRHSNETAKNRRAIYTQVYTLKKDLKKHISTIHKSGFNAIVIDIKDDYGYIYIPTHNAMAQEIKAVKDTLPIQKILSALKKENIYTIARIVVFKDRQLYRAYSGKFAIKDKKTGMPWKGNPREYWVDPHSEAVHSYNIAIARECRKLGFDEIQFDYIRFPSDGDLSRCDYTFRTDPEAYKSEVLCDFLSRARTEVNAAISTDIYGFNSWYRFGNIIGQNMEEFAGLVDVICPMVYPSHFGNKFYMQGPRKNRPYRIVYDSGRRALNICGPVLIRPYLQAFRLMSPSWGPEYISSQAQAAEDSGCSGFTFWNASGNYEMLEKAFPRKQK